MVSSDVVLLRTPCMDSPGWTRKSAAIPVQEFKEKIKKAIAKVINLFI
ncbi:MAG: hypothetical protein ACPK85_08750 [Methanosarcina sp.]